MNSCLSGSQYVRLAPRAARAVAPYLGVPAEAFDELIVDLVTWPAAIRPSPRRAQDGRLIAGDPLLLDAGDDGLFFAAVGGSAVLVPWIDVRSLEPLGVARECAMA